MPTEPYQHNLQYWFAHSNRWSPTSSKISESSLIFEEITLTSIKRSLKDWSRITIFYYFIYGENNKIGNIGTTLKCGNICIRSTTITKYIIWSLGESKNNEDIQISAHDAFLE